MGESATKRCWLCGVPAMDSDTRCAKCVDLARLSPDLREIAVNAGFARARQRQMIAKGQQWENGTVEYAQLLVETEEEVRCWERRVWALREGKL